jgi:hypothetical protein
MSDGVAFAEELKQRGQRRELAPDGYARRVFEFWMLANTRFRAARPTQTA